MTDIEQDGAAEATPPGADRAPDADLGLGSLRRGQWSRQHGSADAESGGARSSGLVETVPPETTGFGPDGPDSDAEHLIPAGSGTRTARRFVVPGVAGVAVVGVVAALVWAVSSSSSGPTRISTAAAGSALSTSPAPAGAPFRVIAATTPTAASHAPLTQASPARHQPAQPAQPVESVEPAASPDLAGPGQGPGPAAAPWPNAVGIWPLNETGGDVAQDYASGATAAQNGTASNGYWINYGCLFNGSESQIYTDAPVLDTGSGDSFTVAATVYLDSLPADPHDETALSQDANENSAFSLQYYAATNRWEFSRFAHDSFGSSAYTSSSTSAPQFKTWTYLVGVYDAANNTQYLYVNGVLQDSQAVDPTPFASAGAFVIGRGLQNGASTDWFYGAIKNVAVFDHALDSSQVAALSKLGDAS